MMDCTSSNLTFNEETCELFSRIIQQDKLNVKVLFYIVQCEKIHISVTVKSIVTNVSCTRRIAVKDSKNKIVSFSNIEGLIDRKTAEKIIDRLLYASLIYFDVQHPYKYIKLTQRGVQVAIHIRKNMEDN